MYLKRFFTNPLPYVTQLYYSIVVLIIDSVIKEYTIGQNKYAIPTEMTTIQERVRIARQQYEEEERDLIERYVDPAAKVVELGGCLGVVSCELNKKLLNPIHHIVLEPNPELIPNLEINRRLNGCSFQIENKVISKREEETFSYDNNILCGSIVKKSESNQQRAVSGISLKELESKYDIKFDTLIADIEGSEYELLTDHIDHIKKFKLIILEQHPPIIGKEKVNEIHNLLVQAGFALVETQDTVEVWKK